MRNNKGYTDKELEIANKTNKLLNAMCELHGIRPKTLYRILADFFDMKAKELEDFDYSMKASLDTLKEFD